MNDLLSRIGSLVDNDGTTHLADYTYVGLGRIVAARSPQPGTELTYIKLAGEPNGRRRGSIHRAGTGSAG